MNKSLKNLSILSALAFALIPVSAHAQQGADLLSKERF